MDLSQLEGSAVNSLADFLMENGSNWHRLLCPHCVPSTRSPTGSTEKARIRGHRDKFTYKYLLCLGDDLSRYPSRDGQPVQNTSSTFFLPEEMHSESPDLEPCPHGYVAYHSCALKAMSHSAEHCKPAAFCMECRVRMRRRVDLTLRLERHSTDPLRCRRDAHIAERWGIYHPDNAQTDKNAGATSNLKEETEWEVVEDEEAVVDDEMTISEHETAINEDETTQELQLTRMPGSWIPEVSRTIRDYCCRRFDRRIILP